MPASRFFSVLIAGKRIKFTENQLQMAMLCDISAISLANPKYYETVKRGFINSARSADIGEVAEAVDHNPAIDSGSEVAMHAMFAAVRAAKGGPSV